jgi:autoinducer 2-degrading protein
VSKKPIYLFAKWKVREGNLEKVLSLLPKLAELSRAEEGCIFYRVHQGRSETHTLMLYESYRDEAALDAHRASEHFQRMVVGEILPMLEGREPFLADLVEV